MADDRLTAALEEIRSRQRHFADAPALADESLHSWLTVRQKLCAEDVPPLLAALDAVLKDHQPGRIVVFGTLCKRHENHRHFSITGTEADDVRACRDCKATVYTSCTGCGPPVSFEKCPVRTVITCKLTGEENPGA